MSKEEAREEVLNRIRRALPGGASDRDASYALVRRSYLRRGSLAPQNRVELFLDRLRDYDAQVIPVRDAAEIRRTVGSVMQSSGDKLLLLPEAWPREWTPEDVEILVDRALSTEELERPQAVLTTCEAAVAATGTIFLVHGGTQGRRVATLLPDHHICIVREDQIVETVPEGVAVVRPFARQPITTVSGPSATSDIEMTRIRGVHGPRRLSVLLLREARS